MVEAGIQERMWECSRILKAQNYFVSAMFFWPTQITSSAQIRGGAAKSYRKRCAYREGWKVQVIFAINLHIT